jgi:error-prone DNA polymerase
LERRKDETGIANLVVWPDLYEKQRRIILTAGMMAVHGRIQREGDVVHLIAHRLTDLSAELAGIGERDIAFPVPHGRGDEAKSGGGPDAREISSEALDHVPPGRGPPGRKAREIYVRDFHIDTIKVKTRDFR